MHKLICLGGTVCSMFRMAHLLLFSAFLLLFPVFKASSSSGPFLHPDEEKEEDLENSQLQLKKEMSPLHYSLENKRGLAKKSCESHKVMLEDLYQIAKEEIAHLEACIDNFD